MAFSDERTPEERQRVIAIQAKIRSELDALGAPDLADALDGALRAI